MHYQAGTTCHVPMAVISRPLSPHTQAGMRPLFICHLGSTKWTTLRIPPTVASGHTASPLKPVTPLNKLLCDAKATELGSHRPTQPTTAAREVPQSGHLRIALHPPVHPASRAGSPSMRSTTVVLCAAAPTLLWATPYRRPLGMTHKVGWRHIGAPIPAPFRRIRCTFAEVSTVMGHSRLRNVETMCPAIRLCRPHGSGEAHPLVHER